MPADRLRKIGEFGLIARIAKNAFVKKNIIQGIGDDTAVLPFTPSKYLLLTADMLCEDVHFQHRENARLVGHKSLACSLSDIAAMGGAATGAVVSIGLPKGLCVRYVDDLYRGMNALARKFSVSLVGGDTITSPRLIINVAVVGEVKKKDLVLRSGARAGDVIFVTGPLGRSFPTKKHLNFTPRLSEARELVKHFKPNAMIDISDGLIADLGHILEESGKGAVLFEDAIPRTKGASLKNALYDGEDFELLFTMPTRSADRLKREKKSRIYPIGRIVTGAPKIFLQDKKGILRLAKRKGYTHF